MESQEQSPKLLEQVRNVMRWHHHSIHTERTCIDWIQRYIHFHHMWSREDLANAEGKIEAFLTDLEVKGKVDDLGAEEFLQGFEKRFRPGQESGAGWRLGAGSGGWSRWRSGWR